MEERLIADLLNAADALLEGEDREVQVPPADWQEDGIALRLDKQLLPLVRQQAP